LPLHGTFYIMKDCTLHFKNNNVTIYHSTTENGKLKRTDGQTVCWNKKLEMCNKNNASVYHEWNNFRI